MGKRRFADDAETVRLAMEKSIRDSELDAYTEFNCFKKINVFVYKLMFLKNILARGTHIIHSFIQANSVAPLKVHYHSEALPTQHGYCVGVSHRSATCDSG